MVFCVYKTVYKFPSIDAYFEFKVCWINTFTAYISTVYRVCLAQPFPTRIAVIFHLLFICSFVLLFVKVQIILPWTCLMRDRVIHPLPKYTARLDIIDSWLNSSQYPVINILHFSRRCKVFFVLFWLSGFQCRCFRKIRLFLSRFHSFLYSAIFSFCSVIYSKQPIVVYVNKISIKNLYNFSHFFLLDIILYYKRVYVIVPT